MCMYYYIEQSRYEDKHHLQYNTIGQSVHNIKYMHDIGQSFHKRHEHVIICLFTTYSIDYMFMYMYYIGQSVQRRFAHYGIA